MYYAFCCISATYYEIHAKKLRNSCIFFQYSFGYKTPVMKVWIQEKKLLFFKTFLPKNLKKVLVKWKNEKQNNNNNNNNNNHI